MADKIYLKGIFCFREDTLENWEKNNPVLEKGELGFVGDGQNGEWLKIGDGVTPWKELEYKKAPKGDDGENYILTDEDKNEIANLVLENFVDVAVIGQ